MPTHNGLRAGVISDTHGLLRPEALAFLRGCDHILHAGDVCEATVLEQLTAIASVTAVRGNNDKGAWAKALPETRKVRLGDVTVYMIHDLKQLDSDAIAAGVQVVISGHSHHPRIERRDGVLYLNPGSAGPRRFRLPITAAELTIRGSGVQARIVDLASEVTRPARSVPRGS